MNAPVATLAEDWLLLEAGQPEPDEIAGPLYEAGHRGELLLRFCVERGHPLDLDQVRCEVCGAGARWGEAAPHGRVLASIVMHRIERSLVAVDAPYPVFDVELDSGHRLYLASAEPTARPVEPGTEIDIGWVRVGERAVPRVVLRTQPRSSS